MVEDQELDLSELLDHSTPEGEAQRKVASFCRIDLQNLDIALSRHPAIYAYCAAVYEMAKVKEARAKWDMEKAKAQAFSIVMDQGRANKITATEAAEKVKQVPLYQQSMDALLSAEVITGRMKALVDGLSHRRDMLVQISARQRAEMSG